MKELPKEYGTKMEDFIQQIFYAGIKEGIRMCKDLIDDDGVSCKSTCCDNTDPEDMCDDCDCWKHFRKMCS
jgi:hypothetical protein